MKVPALLLYLSRCLVCSRRQVDSSRMLTVVRHLETSLHPGANDLCSLVRTNRERGVRVGETAWRQATAGRKMLSPLPNSAVSSDPPLRNNMQDRTTTLGEAGDYRPESESRWRTAWLSSSCCLFPLPKPSCNMWDSC